MNSIHEAPLLQSFRDVANFSKHAAVPENWVLLLSDVRGSTQAVHDGRYKDVNTVGASSIIAVLNATGDDVAFSFGGDGAVFLVPPALAEKAVEALLGARRLAAEAFKLDLRVGRIPVAELYKRGHSLKIARHQLSKNHIQSVLSGSGIQAAEAWVHDASPENPWHVRDDGKGAAPNFEGLECRWSPVRSRRGEIVSLLIMSLEAESVHGCYSELLGYIDEVYGTETCRPIAKERLRLALSPLAFKNESRVRSFGRGWTGFWSYLIKTFAVTRFVSFLWNWLGDEFGRRYRKEVEENTDYRKFDGVLRMVLDGNSAQRQRLENYLRNRFNRGELVYGIHVSGAAQLTCLIFDRYNGKHLHLVDGAEGGYAEAALQLKSQLSQLSSQRQAA